ncbi:MAG: aminotransferase class I/II-fold pyridoxal phosphate-dependent enzyme [Candidatus Dadabacteria bacterium]|nr:MAG: aminotransferase class I/II-fold pyridoxal phosphate-dependent enzyme [Candidatus Dadabacteria bacterium]
MPRTIISTRSENTPPSPIRRLDPLARRAEKEGRTVYYLNIGQPDIRTPREFYKGVRRYREKTLPYSRSSGHEGLCQSWSSYLKRNNGLDISADQFVIVCGASEAIVFSFVICCDPGDEVIIFDPTYANYHGFAGMTGVNLIPVVTSSENGFAIPAREEIERTITRRTRAIMVCTPNNPTGSVCSAADLKMLLEVCEKHNLVLMVDETYREFVYDGYEPLSIYHVAPANPRVIVFDSLSKRFSMCGARVGCLITYNQKILASARTLASARLSAPTLDQAGAAFMLDRISPRYLQKAVLEYQKRRNILIEELGVSDHFLIHRSPGAFYTLVKIPVSDAEDFVKYMLTEFSYKNQTVFVAPGNGFYTNRALGDNKIRIAYVLNCKAMKKAAEVLRIGLEEYLGQKGGEDIPKSEKQ